MNPRHTGTWTEWYKTLGQAGTRIFWYMDNLIYPISIPNPTPIPNPNGLPNPSHKQHCPERFAPIPKPNTKHLPKPYLKPLSKYIFNNLSLHFLFSDYRFG